MRMPSYDELRIVNVEELDAVLVAMPLIKPKPESSTANGAARPPDGPARGPEELFAYLGNWPWLVAKIGAPDNGKDRSSHFKNVAWDLFESGLSHDEVLAVAGESAFAAKYREGRDDLEKWIEKEHEDWTAKGALIKRGPGKSEEPQYLPDTADVFDLLQEPAPPRLWHVQGWIPAHDVTLLGGDGGTGKTLLALMLGYATAYGWSWLGMEVTQCPVIYYGAEEPMKELHWRFERIAKPLVSVVPKPGQFKAISVANADAELYTFDDGTPKPTLALKRLEQDIRAMKAGLLILDAVADVFGGNEIDRRQVRSFIRALRGIAIRNSCTIVLLAHPSVDGIKTGRGYSGSTHWNNAVRSRVYFTTPAAEGDAGIDPDLRVLTVEKANRAAKGTSLMLRWRDDTFVVETGVSVVSLIERAHVNSVFLELLRKFDARSVTVTNTKGPNYAPPNFEQDEGAQGIKRKAFAKAMNFLLDTKAIEVIETGPMTRRRKQLREVSKVDEGQANAT